MSGILEPEFEKEKGWEKRWLEQDWIKSTYDGILKTEGGEKADEFLKAMADIYDMILKREGEEKAEEFLKGVEIEEDYKAWKARMRRDWKRLEEMDRTIDEICRRDDPEDEEKKLPKD